MSTSTEDVHENKKSRKAVAEEKDGHLAGPTMPQKKFYRSRAHW